MLKTKYPKREKEKKITSPNTKNRFVSKKLIKVIPSLNYVKGENGQTSGLRSTFNIPGGSLLRGGKELRALLSKC